MDTRRTAIKAVTFDLWETLLLEKDGANQQRTVLRCKRLSRTLSKFGVNIQPEQIASAIDKMISSLLKTWNKNKDVATVDQIRLVIKYASKGQTKLRQERMGQLAKAYVTPLFELPPYLNLDAEKVLQKLKNQNKKIGLICNTGLTPGTALREFLGDQGVGQYFDAMIFSNEVKIRKPDPEIFCLTARKLRLQPKEILHVGDNLKADIWGAKAAGFKAIHLKTEEGRDQTAWLDPTSLVSRSRNLGQIRNQPTPPDKTITSLAMLIEALEELSQYQLTI